MKHTTQIVKKECNLAPWPECPNTQCLTCHDRNQLALTFGQFITDLTNLESQEQPKK